MTAERYARFMGRFSVPLADAFVGLTGARVGMRALDVGCGPGALTARLVDRLGPAQVCAVDPSAGFVAAVRTRWPDLDVRQGTAEALPFEDATFDVATAQLVVHFMADPVGGLREMGRVASGGTVAACVWDHAGGGGPLACSGARPSRWTLMLGTSPGSPVPPKVSWARSRGPQG